MSTVVARMGKPHGIRGEVTVEVRTDDPEDRFVPGASFATDPDIGTLTLRTARWHRDRLLLSFAEITDRTRAEEVRNTLLVLTGDEADTVEDEAWYVEDLVDAEVFVAGERIGTVTAVTGTPAQDLLVIDHVAGHEVLVPFVTAIVPVVDLEAGRVELTPPPGLLELLDEPDDAAPAATPAPRCGSPSQWPR